MKKSNDGNFVQGEVVAMRLDPEMKVEKHAGQQLGLLWIEDGCHKCLAAFINLLGLLSISKDFSDESLQNGNVKALLESLMRIPTVLKVVAEDADFVSNQIGRIIKQNADAQVQPISSYEWAMTLKSLQDFNADLTFTAALSLYNEHPVVKAYEHSEP